MTPTPPKPANVNDLTRLLVIVACMAIIAAVGYYFWGEYRASRARAEAVADERAAHAELFEYAKAKRSEPEKVARWCKNLAAKMERDIEARTNRIVRQAVSNCRYFGYM